MANLLLNEYIELIEAWDDIDSDDLDDEENVEPEQSFADRFISYVFENLPRFRGWTAHILEDVGLDNVAGMKWVSPNYDTVIYSTIMNVHRASFTFSEVDETNFQGFNPEKDTTQWSAPRGTTDIDELFGHFKDVLTDFINVRFPRM